MKYLWPRSLVGQFSLLLVVAVIAAQVAAFAVFTSETSRFRSAAGRTQMADRIATLVRVIDKVPAGSAADVAAAFGSARYRFSIGDASLVGPEGMGADERRFVKALKRQLGANASDPRIALVERGFTAEGEVGPSRPRDEAPEVLRASVRLLDGRWLNGEAPLRLPAAPQLDIGLWSLAASVLAILVVMAFMVRRITRPLTALADAARRVGRGEAVGPVPAGGTREVDSTVAAFNEMQRRLTRFVADRTRMLAAISHDLRTPITSLRLRAEMVEDADLRSAMVGTLADMQRMIEATLSFARDDAVTEETRAVDLVALLEAVVEDHRAIGHDVTLRAPDDLTYRCRPTMLRRAVANLVENAVRYGRRARVALRSGPPGGGPRIVVDDDGPGLPPERIEDMFEPFVRNETSRSDETGGIGLGLAIARSVARAHGGDITIVNRTGGGLRAEVALPPAPLREAH